jgi:small-conductance mechanosensitive channel
MFPEAAAVHMADNSEAVLEEMLKRKREANTEDPFIYVKNLGENGINLYLR